MKIKPLRDFVLIEPIKKETTKSGLYIEDSTDHTTGIVKAVGEDVSLEKGDTVLYNTFISNSACLIEKQIVLKEEDIVAIIK